MADVETIRDEILTEMYAEAEPPLDFQWAKNNADQMGDDWYKQHHLSQVRQREIFDKHIEQNNLTKSEESALAWTCILDLGPTTSEVDQ